MLNGKSALRLFISAGEPSGDLHGANLVRALRQRGDIECVGLGGPRMAAAGTTLLADLTKFAVMGFIRVLRHVPDFWRILWLADRAFREQRPDAVILIDFPGFHWWLAWRAKAHGIPVYYYGTPQMWAWAPWRVRKMRRLVNHVLCKLPFEETWYRQRGCPAIYVGHPYFDELSTRTVDTQLVQALRGTPGSPLVAILPGSRIQEVQVNLPPFLKAAAEIAKQYPAVRFAIASFNAQQAEMAERLCQDRSLPITILTQRTAEVLEAARCCLACSGSVSLELLYHEKPSVIHYGISRVAFEAQRIFRTAKFITLVNLLASPSIARSRHERAYDPDDPQSERVPFPEYLTYHDRTHDMARWIGRWLQDNVEYDHVVGQLRELKRQYAQTGASERAANYIVATLQSSTNSPLLPPHWNRPAARFQAETHRSDQHVDR